MPVYDLYGKTMRVNLNNMGRQAAAKVLSGQADVGSGVARSISRNPKLRIIHTSRPLPMSGVYVSPTLTQREQDDISRILLNAPVALQQQSHYAQGQPVDYTQFMRIVQRVEEVTSCTDWQQEKVNLFCQSIVGTTSGYTAQAEMVNFSLQGEDGKTYRVVLPRAILNRDPNLVSPASLNFKKVSITNVQPVMVEGIPELRITEPGQFSVAAS
jgi:serine/threonine-protein kinase